MLDLTHKDLQAAAKNINAVFELKPQIKTITSRPNLEKAIKEALAPAVSAGDSRIDLLDEATINAYNALIQPNAIAEVAAEMEEEDAQAEAELETVDAGEGDEECPVFGKEFDPSAPECTECARAEDCMPLTQAATVTTKKEEKPAKTKTTTTKEPKYSRTNAFADTLASNIGAVLSREEVITQTDAKYVEAGGTSNPKESAWIVRTSIRAMVLLGIVEETKEGYKYLGPPSV